MTAQGHLMLRFRCPPMTAKAELQPLLRAIGAS
jgi:hypothetical protein